MFERDVDFIGQMELLFANIYFLQFAGNQPVFVYAWCSRIVYEMRRVFNALTPNRPYRHSK